MSFMRVDMRAAIEVMVEAMLPRFSRNIGLKVTIDAKYAIYSKDGESDKDVRKEITFLVMRPMNYTQVYVQVDQESKTKIWKKVSDHDSCWPSGIDTVLSNVHREAFQVLGREFPDIGVSEFISFSLFHKPIYVELEEREKGCKPVNPKDRNDRSYEINMREIEIKQQMKEVTK